MIRSFVEDMFELASLGVVVGFVALLARGAGAA